MFSMACTKVKLIYFSQFSFCIILVMRFLPVGKEIREKFSGAVEAFSRRNPANASPCGDHTKHRSFEDVPVQKDLVILFNNKNI